MTRVLSDEGGDDGDVFYILDGVRVPLPIPADYLAQRVLGFEYFLSIGPGLPRWALIEVGFQSLSLPTIASGSAVNAPAIIPDTGVSLPTIASGHLLSPPTVGNEQSLTLPTIASGSALFAPTVDGSTFAPSDIAGLLLWLDAEEGVYTDAGTTLATNGQTVQQWNDQSGNANHATQATSGSRPTYTTGVIHGRPALRFDATDDHMLTGLDLSAAPYTVFCVYSRRTATVAGSRALNGTSNWLIGAHNGANRAYANGFLDTSAPLVSVNTFVRACVTNNGTTGKYYRYGTDRTALNQVGTVGDLIVGGGGGGMFNEVTNGDIVEVIVYDTVLSQADREDVDAYLAARWDPGNLTTLGPANVPNCYLWLKADAGAYNDAGVTLATNGQTVQQWNDQSGAGNHVAQASSGLRPTYVTGVVNGLPAIRFDGSDDYLGSIEIPSPFTVFVVYAEHITDTSQRAIAGTFDWMIGIISDSHRVLINGGTVNDTSLASTEDVFTAGAATNDDSGVSANTKAYFDGVDETVGGHATAYFLPGVTYIGGGAGAFPTHVLNGDILEVIVFFGVLSPTDRAAVDAYIVDRLT